MQTIAKLRNLWVTAFIVFALDQLSKWAVVFMMDLQTQGYIPIFPPFLTFKMGWNTGINFGLFSGDTAFAQWVLIALSLGISIWVIRSVAQKDADTRLQLSAGLLVGGALGNALDRVLYGAVADFLNMSCCGIENPFVFNVADIGIFAGAAGLMLFWDKAANKQT